MKSRTFAVGDIHGCYDELMLLMEKLKKEAKLDYEKDVVVFVGDHIDRGPKSKQVVTQLMKWKEKYPHWQFLYGNHEDLMLDALIGNGQIYQSYDLWWMQGGKETAQSYIPPDRTMYEKAISSVKDSIPWKHLDWLRNLPYYYENEDYFFVHAGIPPKLTLGEFKLKIDQNDAETKKQAIWIRDEFIDNTKYWGKKIIYGHTVVPSFQPVVKENKIGIDTAICAVNGTGRLIAIELPVEKFYQQESLIKINI